MTYNALQAAKVRINNKLEAAKLGLNLAIGNNMKHVVPIREASVNAYTQALDIVNDEIANMVALGLATREEPIVQQNIQTETEQNA
jgi:hypothetical protein